MLGEKFCCAIYINTPVFSVGWYIHVNAKKVRRKDLWNANSALETSKNADL